MAVNISAKEFRSPKLVPSIVQTLFELQFDPQNLELEISENILLDDPSAALKIFNTFKEHQFKVVVDNFGLGFSSPHLLQQLIVDRIKIDKKIIQAIGSDAANDTLAVT